MKVSIAPRHQFNPNYRKDQLHRSIKAIDPRDGSTIVDARIYWPGSVAYAAVWINGDAIHASGTGKAGGYGYCKESAALAEALERAGVELSENIAGRGQGAMREAVEAVAKAVTGKRRVLIVEAYA